MADKHEIVKVEGVTPMEILAGAVADGKIDAESIKVLAELTWKDQDRNARKEFNAALVAFRKACPKIEKTKPGPVLDKAGTGAPAYWYTPLEVLEPIARPLLTDSGFSYSWDSQVDGGIITATYILRHENGHEERSSFSCPTDNPSPKMTGQQKYGGGLKFAMRKSMESMLGIVEEGVDLDGQGPEKPPAYETIDATQAADLGALIDEVCDTPEKRAECLQWLRIKRVEDLPAKAYEKALKALVARRGQAK